MKQTTNTNLIQFVNLLGWHLNKSLISNVYCYVKTDLHKIDEQGGRSWRYNQSGALWITEDNKIMFGIFTCGYDFFDKKIDVTDDLLLVTNIDDIVNYCDNLLTELQQQHIDRIASNKLVLISV